jgi:2-pyrone-4,6-dicarboxylate lactonase
MKSCMPPDPNTRIPEFSLPSQSCDSHCHVFGPGHKFPYAPGRKYTPPDAPVEKIRKLHSLLGVERAVLVQASCHGTDNRAMLDAISTSGGAYRGVAIVDETFSEDDLQKLHEGGIRGARFNFVKHLGGAPDLQVLKRVVEKIKPLGWHLVLHFDAENIPEFEPLIRSIPIPIIIDHMGRVKTAAGTNQPPFRLLLKLMANESYWVKVCGAERISSAGPPFTDAVPFAQALIEAAPDRVLWGTDWPHPNIAQHMPNDGDLVDLIPLFTSDPILQAKILVENPARLYGFNA